jgi:4-hydroxybenzoate polyprenyltransferase
MAYLKIVRPVNLLFIVLVQCLIKFVLFSAFDPETALNTFQFLLLPLATISIAAAGYVINDIFDVEIDRINRPERVLVGTKISERSAYNFYILLNILGVGSGFILANLLGKPGLAAIFIIISALLYIYATQLKAMLLFGNLLVSLLVAMSLLVVIIFDVYPVISGSLSDSQGRVSEIVLHYAVFAFVISFIREIVKDLEDINGDKNGGVNSLAISMGRLRTTQLVFSLAAITIVGLVVYLYNYLYDKQIQVLYFLLLIVAPLLYFCIKCWGAERKQEYHKLSLLLKIVMFTGMCSLICYSFI